MIIGGERIMTDKKIVSIAPSTKEVLGQVSSCEQELADKAIQTAHKAFQTWSRTSAEERICCVRRLVDLMKKNRFLIDAWSIEESGKTGAKQMESSVKLWTFSTPTSCICVSLIKAWNW